MVTAACDGGSSSVTGPDAPAAAVPPAAGATIVGTVQSGTSAAGELGASSVAGLRVSVSGTAIQTTTDGFGRFTLSGVPGDRVELRFEGPGLDARLEIEGLQGGQTLNLTVRVSGSSASRVDDDGSDDDGDEIEFKARVDSVGSTSLVVGGRTVLVNDSTRILDRSNMPLPLSGLAVGDFVEVEAFTQADGSLLAKKVKLEDEDDDDENENEDGQDVEFKGTIASTSPLVIGGRTVTTDARTQYLGRRNERLTASQVLMAGNLVEVEGHVQADRSVLAKKIKLED